MILSNDVLFDLVFGFSLINIITCKVITFLDLTINITPLSICLCCLLSDWCVWNDINAYDNQIFQRNRFSLVSINPNKCSFTITFWKKMKRVRLAIKRKRLWGERPHLIFMGLSCAKLQSHLENPDEPKKFVRDKSGLTYDSIPITWNAKMYNWSIKNHNNPEPPRLRGNFTRINKKQNLFQSTSYW